VNKKKILFVGSLPPPYHGSATYFQNLINHPEIQKKFDVITLNTSESRSDLENVGRIDFINIKTAVGNLFQFRKLCSKEKPDLVYLNTPQGIAYFREGLFVLITKMFSKACIIQHLHGSEFLNFFGRSNFLFRFFINITQKRIDYSIVLSENLKYIFRKWNKLENIFAVPNGIHTDVDFEQRELNGRLPVLFFFGNLYKFKGLILSLEILEIVKRRFPEIKMNIAGNWGYDGYFNLPQNAIKEEFFRVIKEKKLQDNVNFIGPAYGKDKIELLLNSDLLVYPTYMDGFPIVLLEAMSAGCPVVTTRMVGSIPEVVVNNETGYLISDYLPERYAEALINIINNPALFKKLSVNSQKRFKEKYTLDISIQNISNTFEKILGLCAE
jgi:glycosyltransferase involved in cell wall biosynthesis